MPVIVVQGVHAAVGTTTVAAGLSFLLARSGQRVRTVRLAADGATSDQAAASRDAEALAALTFTDASLAVIAASDLSAPETGVLVIDAGTSEATDLVTRLGATLVAVADGCDADTAAAAASGAAHTVLTHVPTVTTPSQPAAAAAWALPEDRLLAAPTVGALIERIGARVITRSTEGERALCEHIVLGAIAADSDQPHFSRFPRKAVVTRAERVDIGLSALGADTACLILSGGSDPSPYLLDRVGSGRETTLLVAPRGTVETARDLEDCFGQSPFSHEVKAERAGELLSATLDAAALAGLIGA